ncbi:hypothetical protein AX16_001489 [Volvariella volvacea WC 439]|nr:hypothetical protein AX16_001489 [Volvariella volvacea WC 439]
MLYKSDSPPPELYNSPPPAFTSLPQDYTGNSYNGAKPLPKIPPSTTGSSVYSDTKSLPQYQTQPILPLQSQITPNRRGTNAPPTNLENQAVQPQMLGYSAPSVPRGVRSQEFHTQAKPPSEEPLRPQRPLSMVSDVDSAAGSHAHGYNPFTGGVQYEQRSFAAAGSAVGYTPGSAPAPAYNSLAHARSQNNLNGSPPPGQPSIQQQFAQQPNFGNQGYPNYSAQRQHNVAAPPSVIVFPLSLMKSASSS